MRELNDSEKMKYDQLMGIADRFNAVNYGDPESIRQQAEEFKYQREHDDEKSVVEHRSLDALSHMPYSIIKADGTKKDHNQKIKPFRKFYRKGKLIAEIYRAGKNEYAVKLIGRKISERRKKNMKSTGVRFDVGDSRVVSVTGISYECFMLDSSNRSSKQVLEHTYDTRVCDLWDYAVKHDRS